MTNTIHQNHIPNLSVDGIYEIRYSLCFVFDATLLVLDLLGRNCKSNIRLTVLSNCSLVAPHFSATAMPCVGGKKKYYQS